MNNGTSRLVFIPEDDRLCVSCTGGQLPSEPHASCGDVALVPSGVSPKPNVTQTSGDTPHTLIVSTHKYVRMRASSTSVIMTAS